MHPSTSDPAPAPAKAPIALPQAPPNAPTPGEFTVSVYASSSSRVSSSYRLAAHSLGRALALRGWVQTNGGGGGLMGHCTAGGVSAGGIVDCVILRQFLANISPGPFRRVSVLDAMVDRRAGLYKCANAFVALPGGLGSLEEIAEVASWRQLEYHERVVVLLNTDGFYDGLWSFVERGIREGFIAEGVRSCVKKADTVEECVRAIEDYRPVPIHKNAALSGGPEGMQAGDEGGEAKADWIPTHLK